MPVPTGERRWEQLERNDSVTDSDVSEDGVANHGFETFK